MEPLRMSRIKPAESRSGCTGNQPDKGTTGERRHSEDAVGGGYKLVAGTWRVGRGVPPWSWAS